MTAPDDLTPEAVEALARRLENVVPDLEGDTPTIIEACEALDSYAAALRALRAASPEEASHD